MSRFSVLIPVYNGADHLEDALASIEKQTLPEVSVVVSDNASTDATPEVLSAWRNRLNLRIIRQTENLQMQHHFNAILAEVKTDRYMLLCHDDYLASEDALLFADQMLSKHPDIPAVYCDLAYVSADKRPLATRRFSRGETFEADNAGRETLRTARNFFGIPIGVRRSALGHLRYDPQFHYVMDVDLSWAMARGRTLAHIAEPLIANRYRDGNTTWTLLRRSRAEFVALARKYDVPLDPMSASRLSVRTWVVNQQKRLFGLYGRAVDWFG